MRAILKQPDGRTPQGLRDNALLSFMYNTGARVAASVADIRDILGHSSIATTSRYISTNPQMKRDALEAFWRRAGISPSAPALETDT
jgi:site-specific recombinase XerD